MKSFQLNLIEFVQNLSVQSMRMYMPKYAFVVLADPPQPPGGSVLRIRLQWWADPLFAAVSWTLLWEFPLAQRPRLEWIGLGRSAVDPPRDVTTISSSHVVLCHTHTTYAQEQNGKRVSLSSQVPTIRTMEGRQLSIAKAPGG